MKGLLLANHVFIIFCVLFACVHGFKNQNLAEELLERHLLRLNEDADRHPHTDFYIDVTPDAFHIYNRVVSPKHEVDLVDDLVVQNEIKDTVSQ